MTRSRSPDAHVATPDAGERYRALFENMAEGFVVCEAIQSPDGQLADYWIRAANPVFVKRGPAGGAMINRRQLELRPDTSKPWLEACERALGGEPVRFEFHDRLSARWYEVHMARLSGTEFGQFFVDVTERKTAEQRLVQLFEELNHRVKNNLTIASSILELQARSSAPAVRDHLRKAVDRLHSIADLHTALYRQNSTDTADLDRYLRDLCERLSCSLFEDGRLRIDLNCEPLEVLVEQAVTIGLIVNELVTNAAKHAFPEGAPGAIIVSLAASDDELHLRVADNGAGLSALGQSKAEGGLGLRLVRSLADGQGGELRLEPSVGAAFHVRLPRRKREASPDFQPRLL
jgi:two-component sensor histidine kinase